MVSKFALLFVLFLAFAAMALPPSHPGARLAGGEDIQPRVPSDRSASIIPRYNYNSDWAGGQHNSWDFNQHAIDYATVTFVVPQVTEGAATNCDVTFALAIGNAGCSSNYIMVGVLFRVEEDRVQPSPVYATSLDNILEFTSPAPAEAGDTITLTIEVSSLFGGVVWIQNSSRSWIRMQHVNSVDHGDGYPVCSVVAQAMVIATRLSELLGGGHVPLANFRTVTFTQFRVHYRASSLGAVPPGFLTYFDIEHGTNLPLTYSRGIDRTIIVSYTNFT